MARDVPATLLAAMQAGVFSPMILIELYFDSGTLNIWSGDGDKIVGGTTYTGVGNLLGFSSAEETSEVIARGMVITLSGVPSDVLSMAFSEAYQNRPCIVRWGDVDVAETAILFEGQIDQINPEESASTAIVSVTVESELARLNKQVIRRYSDQNHKLRFPADDFFSHVTKLSEAVQWGGSATNATKTDVHPTIGDVNPIGA